MSELPEGWAEATLGSLGTWSSGGTPSKSNHAYWNGAIPWVSPKDLKTDFITDSIDHVTEAGVAAANLKIFPPGTLLFVVRGMILARAFPVALTRVPVAVNQDIRALTPHAGLDAGFVFRALQNEAHRILFAVKEATHGTLRLDSDQLQQWPIRIAPLAEQRRIREKIEVLNARALAATKSVSNVSAKRVRASLLATAFSGELTRVWRQDQRRATREAGVSKWPAESHKLRRGIPENVAIPDSLRAIELPKTWTLKSNAQLLRERALFDLKDGNHGANHPKVSEFSTTGLPFITAAQVRNYSIDYDSAPRVAGPSLDRLRVGFATPGDVVLTHKGSVGRAALNTRSCVLTPQTTYYRSNPDVLDAKYLVYYFTSPQFHAQLRDAMSQTTRDFAPISEQYRLFIILPSLEEQKEIVRRIEVLFSRISATEIALSAAIGYAQLVSTAVLIKAFCGELVPAEAELARREERTYEPASLLLERIRADSDREQRERRRRPLASSHR